MEDVRQTVTRTEQADVDPAGASTIQQTKHVQTETSAGATTTIQNIVWFLLGFVEILLGLRFILKLLGANSGNSFVSFIYSISRPFTAPFDSIFGVTTTTAGQTRSVFVPSILVAMAVYALVAWGIAKLLTINQKS